MELLVITDIPRMTVLFERVALSCPGLTLVNDIHRGIEDLDRRRPDLVIFQNRLSGLSADILHKHLKSRLGSRKTRFVLISTSEALDVDLSARFDAILDPALDDTQLEQTIVKLIGLTSPQDGPLSSETAVTAAEQSEPAISEEQPVPVADAEQAARVFPLTLPADLQREKEEPSEAPLVYELPRRPVRKIISEFSQQLEQQSADHLQQPVQPEVYEEPPVLRDLHQMPHLIADSDLVRPWYRRTAPLLVGVTLVVVVAVSVLQYRTGKTPDEQPPVAKAEGAAVQQPVSSSRVGTSATDPARQNLASHGGGRPRDLPGFVPRDGHEPAYGKQHPGWELYLGATSEHRVFREADGIIKALQIIDRSGAGIQESFYTSVLKELAGATAMRPTSSEVKEGYEIRRGEVAGLQLVQYRDAQGGRLRGFVITWP